MLFIKSIPMWVHLSKDFDYLINDDLTYTFNYKEHEIEIIPEEYFYTVIIPSIAMKFYHVMKNYYHI